MSRLLRLCTYDALVTTVLFLGIVLACGLTPMQTDTWWQLRAGRDMWATGHVMLTDVYSHTAYGSPWPNHEWLAEVIFYGVYRLGGLALVTLFAACLIAGGWAFTWRLTRGAAPDKLLWIGFALVSSAGWWEPRPHAFSLLFIPALGFLLVRERYWWLPAMFLVWANVHGGVLLGLVLLGAGLTAQSLLDLRRWRRSVLVLIACALAVTATPLGLSFWTEIPSSLQRINQYTLDEWARPSITEVELLPFWAIAVTLAVVLLLNVRRLSQLSPADAVLLTCALVLLTGAVSAVRHVGPFLMIGVPALTRLLSPNRRQRVEREVQRPMLNFALIACAVAAVAATLTWAYTTQLDRLKWHPVPDGALAALRQCPDNLYNRYDEGGALLWFAPERRVFLDGRQDPFPPELVLEHIRMETVGAPHEELFERHQIRCAYLPVMSPVASRLQTAGWRTLYSDSLWLVLTQ